MCVFEMEIIFSRETNDIVEYEVSGILFFNLWYVVSYL